MKRLLSLILILLAGYTATAQVDYQLGTKTRNTRVMKDLFVDSSLYLGLKDTLFTPARKGTVVTRPSDGMPYYWNGTRWYNMLNAGLANPAGIENTTTRLVSGNATWRGVGLIFDVTICSYYILGRHFTSPFTTKVLAASDPSLPRIDVIYLDTSGTVGVLTGVPGSSPIKPVVNPLSQLELTNVHIAAGATVPTGIFNTVVYDENVEWTSTYSGTATLTYPLNPQQGSFSARLQSTLNPFTEEYMMFTCDSIIPISNYTYMRFYVRLKTALVDDLSSIEIRIQAAGSSICTPIALRHGAYGFDRHLLNTWQMISVPISPLTPTSSGFDEIKFVAPNEVGDWHVDNVSMQSGTPPIGSQYVTSFNSRTGAVLSTETDYNAWFWGKEGDLGLDSTNFLGHRDSVDLTLKTNNQERLRISARGALGINGDFSTPRKIIQGNGANNPSNWIDAPDVVSEVVAKEHLKTWKVQKTPLDRVWVNLAWSPELRLMVCVSHGATSDGVMTSPDGVNWTARTCPAQEWRGVAWSSKLRLFAAVGGTGTGNRVMTSPDGITWTNRTSTGDYKWRSVTWSDEKEIFVAIANTTGFTDKVMTSTDGITWTARTCPDRAWSDIVYAPELDLFVASATGGIAGEKIMTSPDGITWTLRATPGDLASWEGLGYSEDLRLFVAVSYYGFLTAYPGTRVMTSPDGINWTLRSTPLDAQWLDVAWSHELGMFAAVNDSHAQGVMVSPDGINWTVQTPDQYKYWRRIIWVKELGSFVSCAYTFSLSGVGNLIMMSKPIDRHQQYVITDGRDSQTVNSNIEITKGFKLSNSSKKSNSVLTGDEYGNANWDFKTAPPSTGMIDYGVNFHSNNAFVDSTLVNNLSGATTYFNKGLVLKSASATALDDTYLSLWNYGFVAADQYSQRLTFQVLDSSTDISIGIGVRSGQVSVTNKQMTYISGVLGDSAATTAGSVTNLTGTTSTGILVNKGDFIELTSSMVALDSTTLIFRNLTTGMYKKVVRKLTTSNSTAVLGYPTIYFAKGHVRLINYSLSRPDFDYVFWGNSITAGFYASDIDSCFVGQTKKWTASSITNGAMSGACTVDFLKVKEGYNIKNKIVFLSGVFGQDPNYVIPAADSKANYQAIVNKLKANNNRVIHIDNPYRNQASWPDILALNQWLDSTYRGIDSIVSIDSLLTYPTDFHDVAHLNNLGNTKIASLIMSSLPSLFERRYTYIQNQYTAKQTAKSWVDSAKATYVESTGDGLINGYTIGRGAGNVLGNTVFGYEAGKQFTSTYSAWNTAVGYHALRLNRVKGWNTAMGLFALANYNDPDSTSLPAGNNTAFGANALRFTTLGKWNTAVGASALLNNTTGINNTAIGLGAGRGITTGSYNTIVGQFETAPFAAGLSNTVVLGDGNASIRFYSPSSTNVLFGTTTDQASSKVTIESTTQGFLIPRMTTAQRDLISTPATGLQVYNTDTKAVEWYNGYSWGNAGLQNQDTRVVAQFDVTSNDAVDDIPGLTAMVITGKTYKFEAILYTSADPAAGIRFAFGGAATATSFIASAITGYSDATNVGTPQVTALGDILGDLTTTTTAGASTRITGTITVATTGTLTVQFAQNVSDGATSSVLIGSTFTVTEIN